jgi:hypothetical protein
MLLKNTEYNSCFFSCVFVCVCVTWLRGTLNYQIQVCRPKLCSISKPIPWISTNLVFVSTLNFVLHNTLSSIWSIWASHNIEALQNNAASVAASLREIVGKAPLVLEPDIKWMWVVAMPVVMRQLSVRRNIRIGDWIDLKPFGFRTRNIFF